MPCATTPMRDMADLPGDSLEARQYNMRHFEMRIALKSHRSEVRCGITHG